MKKIIFLILLFSVILFSEKMFAQLTISNGTHVMELSGYVSSYYNHRILKATETDKSKNHFQLEDARFDIEGRIGKNYEYELETNLAEIPNIGKVPDATGLIKATVTYKILRVADITAGYGKTPYSRNSLQPESVSPYWNRPDVVSTTLFRRRDLGITLSKTMWKQRINIYAGAYTGLGELSLLGANDASGQPEYIGRVDVAYPARFRYHDIDMRCVPVPMIAVGVNGRYANKKLPAGTSFPAGAAGETGDIMVNGEKKMVGADVIIQYLNVSAQFEIHQMKAIPQDSSDALFQHWDLANSEGYMMAGGYFAQLNYHSKMLRSLFSARFDELNLNDLSPGEGQKISFSYCYFLRGINSMIRIQYIQNLKEQSLDTHKWSQQYLIGYQLLFR